MFSWLCKYKHQLASYVGNGKESYDILLDCSVEIESPIFGRQCNSRGLSIHMNFSFFYFRRTVQLEKDVKAAVEAARLYVQQQ